MGEHHDPVTEALGTLRAQDPDAAKAAEAAFQSLTWDEGLAAISLHGLQQFLWYQLPRKWLTDLDDKQFLAASLGRLLELAGLPRYAAVCTSEQTADILATYQRDDRRGFAAFQHAEQQSGVAPPDLPELAWGPVMGVHEATAFTSTAAALELAIAGSEFCPGGRGWRTAQEFAARRHLIQPRRELDGRTWLHVIRAERLDDWARSQGAGRRALVEPLTAQLPEPAPTPAGLDQALAPLRWLLDSAIGGLPLTAKGNLGRAVVIDAVNRFGWDPLPNPPRGEDDVFELWALRDLAGELRAVRRSGRRLLATRTGRELAADSEALWRAVAGQLGAGQDFAAIVRELALMILHDGQPHRPEAAIGQITAAATAEGWHDQATGQPPDPEAVRRPWYDLLRALKVLGMAEEHGTWDARTIRLTPIGQATALQALHARATGPRPSPFR